MVPFPLWNPRCEEAIILSLRFPSKSEQYYYSIANSLWFRRKSSLCLVCWVPTAMTTEWLAIKHYSMAAQGPQISRNMRANPAVVYLLLLMHVLHRKEEASKPTVPYWPKLRPQENPLNYCHLYSTYSTSPQS